MAVFYEQKYREQQILMLKKKAALLGLSLTAIP